MNVSERVLSLLGESGEETFATYYVEAGYGPGKGMKRVRVILPSSYSKEEAARAVMTSFDGVKTILTIQKGKDLPFGYVQTLVLNKEDRSAANESLDVDDILVIFDGVPRIIPMKGSDHE